MNVSPLIKQQTIIIDPHRRKYSARWDNSADDIHLHKKAKNNKDYEIRVPLNSKRRVNVTNANGSSTIPGWLKKEVQEAFNDDQKREKFIKDVVSAVKNYNDKTKTQEQRARQAMGNIKRAFGLECSRGVIKGWIRKSLKLYAQLFVEQDNYYHIIITNTQFVIGETSPDTLFDYLKNGAEGKRFSLEFEDD